MKIAIVTPHPVPLALGGAENLWWGLQDYFNQHTQHSCDIVSVLAPEDNFWDLMESYETFSKLDLTGYDCVISGKYPSWMVKHPNHVCYMLHRLRGLYDTYTADLSRASSLTSLPQLQPLLTWIRENELSSDPDYAISGFFDRLRELKTSDLPEWVFAFPGPFSRAAVHFLDNVALSQSRIKRYAAISKTVARRKDYFPPDVLADVLYPPPHLNTYHCGESRYFFTSSRLDRPKRIDLLIEAMRSVPQDISLLIAGTGPDEAQLEEMAKDDHRIRFLGYVADDDMPGLYANALAVPFVPADEDYGLITIEAMKSAKPVLTVTDSGGPCEFVEHGRTGYVCPPSPQELARHLAQMADDKQQAEAMGREALQKVSDINWTTVANGLLDRSHQSIRRPSLNRPKLTVATTFKVYPPMNGGQARVFNLYKELASEFDIDIVSLNTSSEARSEAEIAPGLLEINIPRTDAHAQMEYRISRQIDGKPVGDITASALVGLTPAYGEALELSALTSTAVVASHPYLGSALRKAAPDKPLWYEAHNAEFTLKSDILGDSAAAPALLDEVWKAERECWILAERVFACTTLDLATLEHLYGPTRARLHEVPNGVALEAIPYRSLAERRHLQRQVGLADRQIAIFMGSWHGPNLEAVEDLLRYAPEAPATRFVIIGSVGLPFQDEDLPPNVEIMGAVDMETRDRMLSIADVALNPMKSGSGTNLKMLDYMAAGIPVISTEFGARGLSIVAGQHYLCTETAGLPSALADIRHMSEDSLEQMIVSARSVVEHEYSWKTIAQRFLAELHAAGLHRS